MQDSNFLQAKFIEDKKVSEETEDIGRRKLEPNSGLKSYYNEGLKQGVYNLWHVLINGVFQDTLQLEIILQDFSILVNGSNIRYANKVQTHIYCFQVPHIHQPLSEKYLARKGFKVFHSLNYYETHLPSSPAGRLPREIIDPIYPTIFYRS